MTISFQPEDLSPQVYRLLLLLANLPAGITRSHEFVSYANREVPNSFLDEFTEAAKLLPEYLSQERPDMDPIERRRAEKIAREILNPVEE